jgi:subtilisin family serine protease
MAGFMTRVVTPKDLNCAALQRARVHPSQTGLDGAGTVICIIDYGFDLLHPALRTPSGETRFAALIDQNGCRLTRAEINSLIRDTDRCQSRARLDKIYDPHVNYFGRGVEVGAHGSWVASIAAGTSTPEFTGVAPRATLIGVQLDLPDMAWREEDHVGQPSWFEAVRAGGLALQSWDGWRSYEECHSIVAGLEEGLDFAHTLKPDGIVFNLSIGSWAGGHDDGAAVNRALGDIIHEGRGTNAALTAVVTGAGNAGAEQGHIGGWLSQADPVRFGWHFGADVRSQSKLEIWSDCPGGMVVELTQPCGNTQALSLLDDRQPETLAIRNADGCPIGIGQNRGTVRGQLSCARFMLQPTLTPADMTQQAVLRENGQVFDIVVRPAVPGQRGRVHAWLERDFQGGAIAKLLGRIDDDSDAEIHSSTLTSLACTPGVLSVAGLDTSAADDKALAMSGRGPRPWPSSNAMPSPLLAAPANGLFGARSKTTGYMRGSGTSGAAAIVSGASALAMQAAEISGRRLDTVKLTRALTGSMTGLQSRDEGTPLTWRPDLGFGALRFDAASLFDRDTRAPPSSHPNKKEPRDERVVSAPN